MAFEYEAMFAKVADALLWEENATKLIGILIDRDLSFHAHVKMIGKKGGTANNKINRLPERAPRIAYEDFESTFK